METRQIEILEESIKEGVVTRYRGDICTLPKPLADAYISAGLAKCVATGESGERVAGPSKVSIDSTHMVMKA